MANGYEPLISRHFSNDDRFNLYRSEFENQVIKLKQVHDLLDKNDFEYSKVFERYLDNKRGVDLEYLDPFNRPLIEYQSYSYAMNLFI
jgi:hypothetical protein